MKAVLAARAVRRHQERTAVFPPALQRWPSPKDQHLESPQVPHQKLRSLPSCVLFQVESAENLVLADVPAPVRRDICEREDARRHDQLCAGLVVLAVVSHEQATHGCGGETPASLCGINDREVVKNIALTDLPGVVPEDT